MPQRDRRSLRQALERRRMDDMTYWAGRELMVPGWLKDVRRRLGETQPTVQRDLQDRINQQTRPSTGGGGGGGFPGISTGGPGSGHGSFGGSFGGYGIRMNFMPTSQVRRGRVTIEDLP